MIRTALLLSAAMLTLTACTSARSPGGGTGLLGTFGGQFDGPAAPTTEVAAPAVPDIAPAPAVPGAGAAQPVIAAVIAQEVPGPTGAALASCVIETASVEELARISVDSSADPTPETVLLISDILARPATVSCATTRLA
ncbi:MAG: hypothetical protein ACU0BF_04100 [Paracoccaceae bacterium]